MIICGIEQQDYGFIFRDAYEACLRGTGPKGVAPFFDFDDSARVNEVGITREEGVGKADRSTELVY